VPCGICGMRVTSMERLLGGPVDLKEVSMSLTHNFGMLFGRTMKKAAGQVLHPQLAGVALV
jgi:lipoate-protein ligase B